MNFEIGIKSDVGLKRRGNPNQDTVGIFQPQAGDFRPTLALVADGMGGHNGGELASQTVSAALIDAYRQMPLGGDLPAQLLACVNTAHQVLKQAAARDPEDLAQMGCTLAAAVLLEDTLHIINVGDSRVYLVNDQGIRQISQDQTLVAEGLRAGILTPAEAEVHPRRHMLIMAINVQRESVKPYCDSVAWGAGDALLLCSDGLWNEVPDDVIGSTVCSLPPQAAAERLVELANAAGGPDNISVIVARRAVETSQSPAPEKKPALHTWAWLAVLIGLGLLAAALGLFWLYHL
jgi:PPM family protein phosphatase